MNTYAKMHIYYFSGTGNSKNVARWMAEYAASVKMECTMENIASIDRKNIKTPEPGTLLVFISPVHGFNYPPVMLYFIHRFPKGNNPVLLMNTRAGMLIGNFITPGLSGITFYYAGSLLKLKGYSIKAMYPVDLPSNWFSLHPGLNDRTVKYLHQKNKERINAFNKQVLSGGSNFKGITELGQDLLISPIALLYFFIGRFLIAKSYYASADCDRCTICIKSCPVKAIKEVDGRPYWTFHCESCMRCVGNCPKKAIEAAHGFFIGFLIFFHTIILYLFYHYFSVYFFEIKNELLKFIIEPVIMLGFMAVSYHLVHYLLRFKAFERIMVYSSLTKYKFWGKRYKAIND